MYRLDHVSEAADHPDLLAVMDVIVADDVAADDCLVPTVFQGPVDRLDIAPRAIEFKLRGSVVPAVAVFAQQLPADLYYIFAQVKIFPKPAHLFSCSLFLLS